MINFCVFGGHEGTLPSGRQLHFTMFGASEFTRPTMAKMLATRRTHPELDQPTRPAFITICGGVSITAPPLAEEFSELEAAIRSGETRFEEVDRFIADDRGALRVTRFTLFGGCETDALPTEDAEIESLAVLRHSGAINDAVVQTLMLGIGRTGPQRLSVVRQAVRQLHGQGA